MNPVAAVLEFLEQEGMRPVPSEHLSADDRALARALRRRRSPATARSKSPELLLHLAALSTSQWSAAVWPVVLPVLTGRDVVDISPTFPFSLPILDRVRSLALSPWHPGLPREFARFLISSCDRLVEPGKAHVAVSLEPLAGLAPDDYAAYLARLFDLAPRAVLVLPARSRPSRADWAFDPAAWDAALASVSAAPVSQTAVDSYTVVSLSKTAPQGGN